MDSHHPDVLVLGGGGILGEAWMLGLLAGLEQAAGFDARECDCYVGTSAGSIVAAGLAAGVSPATRLDEMPQQPAPPQRRARRPVWHHPLRVGRVAAAPLAGIALRSTVAGGAALRRTALARVPEGRRSLAGLGRAIERLGVGWDGRLLVTAVEVESGRRVVFGTDDARFLSVARAVEASCAIPGVFRPIREGGRTYVDGGAWSLTNLDAAPVERGTRVLCLNPTGSLATAASLRGAVGAFSRSAAGVEAMVLGRRGAIVRTLGPDANAARVMGMNFMDASRRLQSQRAGFEQGVRAAGEFAAAA